MGKPRQLPANLTLLQTEMVWF